MDLRSNMRVNAKGHLEISGCDVVDLAEDFGTPLYIMDEDLMCKNARSLRSTLREAYPDSEVIYASKAFMCLAMARLMDEEGLGLDVSSGGELYTALEADFPPGRIYFHGNNKTRSELEMALGAGIGRFMVDNMRELTMLDELARHARTRARVILRIAPGVEAHTHKYITTGQVDSKFGLNLSDGQAMAACEAACRMENIEFMGVHCHIGSQIFELDSYRAAVGVMMEFIRDVTTRTGRSVRELDIGGGLGVRYTREDTRVDLGRFAALVAGALRESCWSYGLALPRLIIEPGRYIVGEAGTTIYRIGSMKDIPGVRKYVVIDGGYPDNPRVALYGAKYEAMVANKAAEEPAQVVSIAGRTCESGDMLIWDIKLPRVEPGDLLAVFTTGAYNYSMASNYNRLPRPACIFVTRGKADLVIERESYADLIAKDRIPLRLARVSPKEAAL